MTEEVPDWVTRVPSTDAVHDASAFQSQVQGPEQTQLLAACGQLLGGLPFFSSLLNLGSGQGSMVGSVLAGGQGLADALCGLMTGVPSSGTTADSLLAGASDVSDLVNGNPFASGLVSLGQSGGGSGNLASDAITGGQSFADQLFGMFGACGCGTPPGVIGPDLLTEDMVAGNDEWAWDFPGPEGSAVASQGCVRTKRNGLLTVYYVGGTWEKAEGEGGQGVLDPAVLLDALNDGDLDWSKIEFLNIPYPGTSTFVRDSIDEGVANVTAQINLTPGQFVLAGGSQGANVISDVYDDLRSGGLQARRNDLVLGVAMSNPRRQQGRGWPGGPVYCSSGRGLVEPNLTNTDNLWWEWSVAAGTYPANDSMTGVNYTYGDIAGCCPDTPAGNSARAAYALALAGEPTAAEQATYFAAYTDINNGTGPAHAESPMVVQPLLGSGDHRTFLEIVMDQVNALASSITPPAATRRELAVGDPVAVSAGQVVKAAARAQWCNVVCSGAAIMVKVRVYDSGQNLIDTLTDVDATISNPPANSSGYQSLSGEYTIPSGGATAQMVLDVEPAAMESGTVWFADAIWGDVNPASATPQSVLQTTQQAADALAFNPFAAGMLSMGQANGSSGNIVVDLLNGVQRFVDLLCGAATGQESPGSTPNTLIDGVTESVGGASSAAQDSAFASGILGMGGSSGNLVVDAFTGLQAFVDSLCGIATDQTSSNTTPSAMLSGLGEVSDAANASSFTSGILDLGGDTGNRGVDAIYGMQTFFGALCGVATGSTDVSETTPLSVVQTVQGGTNNLNLVLSGVDRSDATAVDLLDSAADNVARNSASHVGHQAVTPVTAVSLKAQNLLVSQDFSNSYTLSALAHWSWDGTDGDATLGCAVCTCDGTQDELVSSEIPVVVGETVEVACVVKWADLQYSGTDPIILGVQKYRKMRAPNGAGTVYQDVGHYDIDTIVAPGASSSGWQDLAGSYVVQSGVDQLRFRLKAAKTATSGTVKWDNCAFLKLDLIDDAAVPGVGTTVDSIVTELYGTQGAGFTHNDAALALANTAASLVSVTSRVAALEAEGGTGAIAGDDFLYSGELTATANWAGSYSNNMGRFNADGSVASFDEDPAYPSILGSCIAKLDWTGTDNVSETDYQIVQAVLGSSPEYNAAQNKVAYTTLYGRVSADWQSYIVLKIGGDGTYSVSYAVGGSETVMNNGACTVPGVGTLATLWCGNKATVEPRRFAAKLGNTLLCDFTEVGTGSQYGASNLKYGTGGVLQHFSLSSPSIAFDAAGAGDADLLNPLISGSETLSWSHNCRSGAYLLVALVRDAGNYDLDISVSYGGQSMSRVIRSTLYNSTLYGTIELWELYGAVGGTHTITVTSSGYGAQWSAAASTSYRNVASTSGKASVGGRGNSLSQSATRSSGQWIAQVFGADFPGGYITWSGAKGGTRRVHRTGQLVGVSMGDSIVNTTFEENSGIDALNNYWGGISLVMTPASSPVSLPGPYVYPAKIDQWIGMDQ